MSFTARMFNVLIASPSDLTEERLAARDAIYEWNDLHAEAEGIALLPRMWETSVTPEAGDRPQAIINHQIVASADMIVGMFWTKIGTSTGAAESGTVEEVNQMVAAGKPAVLYFSSRKVDPNQIDVKQMKKLKTFKGETYKRAITGTFASPDELKHKLARDLTRVARGLKSETAPADEQTARGQLTVTDVEVATGSNYVEPATADFYARFSAGEFHGLKEPPEIFAVLGGYEEPKPRHAFLLLSVVPLKQANPPLDIAALDQQKPALMRPIEASGGWSWAGYGTRLICYDRPPRDQRTGNEQPTSAVELNDNGSIFAGKRMLVWPKRIDGKDVANLEIFERALLFQMTGYVRLLRELSVTGPLAVQVIIDGMADAYIGSIDPHIHDSRRIRPIRDATVKLKPVTLSAKVDGNSIGEVAEAMRPSFTVIWRDAGYSADPSFDGNGKLREPAP